MCFDSLPSAACQNHALTGSPGIACCLQIANGSLYPQRDRQVRYGNIRYLDELHMEDPSLKFIEVSPAVRDHGCVAQLTQGKDSLKTCAKASDMARIS